MASISHRSRSTQGKAALWLRGLRLFRAAKRSNSTQAVSKYPHLVSNNKRPTGHLGISEVTVFSSGTQSRVSNVLGKISDDRPKVKGGVRQKYTNQRAICWQQNSISGKSYDPRWGWDERIVYLSRLPAARRHSNRSNPTVPFPQFG